VSNYFKLVCGSSRYNSLSLDDRKELAGIWLKFEIGENNQPFFDKTLLANEENLAHNNKASVFDKTLLAGEEPCFQQRGICK